MPGEIEDATYDLTYETSASIVLPTAIDFDGDDVTIEVESDAEFMWFDPENATIHFDEMQKGKYEVQIKYKDDFGAETEFEIKVEVIKSTPFAGFVIPDNEQEEIEEKEEKIE